MRRWSLLTRFAAVSLVLVVLLGAALSQVLSTLITRRGLESAKQAAVLTTAVGIQPLLASHDLRQRLPAATLRTLDGALRGSLSGTEVARLKIWSADARLLYSADPHTSMPADGVSAQASPELAHALRGEVEAELIDTSSEQDNRALLERYGSLLEVYVPIRTASAPAGDPVGVFELYLPYAGVQVAVRRDQRRASLVVGLGLLVLWLGLFRTVATASRQLRRQAERVAYAALHDGLTDLPNRELLQQRLDDALRTAAPGHGALVLLDLDRFQEVNDTLGHTHGDALIVQVGARLGAAVGPEDTVARLGGDEYAVLLPEVVGEPAAIGAAQALREALREPFDVAGLALAVDASAGIAVFPEGGANAETVLRQADVAMYVAKRGHVGHAVYEPGADHHSTTRLQLVAELRTAVEQGQLVVHYQPKLDLTTGAVRGVEALVRWQHPERGLLPPYDFVPTAERTGLIGPLTDVVLDAALGQAKTWIDGGRVVPVSVNISPRSLLDPTFPARVLAVVAAHRLPASVLVLEITETSIMEDPEHALEALQQLHDAGIYLSIDDFGTGYSSLAYLKRLPVDELKVDRSFVSSLTVDARDRLIVASTVALGRALGLDVVAEGVEDEATTLALQDLGCDLAQGYVFGRPAPAEELDWTPAVLVPAGRFDA
ncbi:MAG: putative bifunctional diguanylate cyclase/phosphodiesterase [Actinomycetes bacterium]